MTEFMGERVLYSVEAERSVLGAMLLSDRAAVEAVRYLREEDFYRPAHRLIFRAMADMKGVGIDMVTLEERLKVSGDLANVGGTDYLMDIDLYVPSASNWSAYAQIVTDRAKLRRLESLARETIGKVHSSEEESASSIASWLSLEASSIGGAAAPIVRLEDVNEAGGDTGIGTGIRAIDRVLSTKGIPSGQMTIIAAREKHGKSALLIQMAVEMAQRGIGVHYETLADLNPRRLKRRMLRAMCGFSEASTADEHGFLPEFREAKESLEREMPLTIGDRTRSGSHDVDDLIGSIETMRQRMERTSKPLEVIPLDYVQKLTSRLFKASDALSIANYCSSAISTYAERSGLAIVGGSQLTDGNEKEMRDPMTKGSRQWLEDCGLCLWIHRGEGQSAQLRILRSRFGGMGTKVDMIYQETDLRFVAVNA